MSRIAQLRQKKADLLKEANILTAKEDAGTITAEEMTRFNAIVAEDGDLTKVNAQIQAEERLMDERRSMDATTGANGNADTATEAAAKLPAAAKTDAPKFATFGEQMMAICKAGQPGGASSVDPRLTMAAGPTGMNEGIGAEGGFLVQQDFQTQLLQDLYAGGDILKLLNVQPIGANANGIKQNGVDETSRANGSRAGGIQAFWTGEAQLKRDSKPAFRQISMELDKLTGLLYATDELLQDTVSLEAWIKKAFNDEFTFKVEDAVINGTGSGMPLGILNSGAVVSVAKTTGQPAVSINTYNILQMFSRLPARSRKTAVWLINSELEPLLGQLYTPVTNVAGTENVGGIPAVGVNYTPPGYNGNEYATLQGRPVIPCEYCAAAGTVGDIILADMSQYLAIDKGQTQFNSSIHARFVYDETVFRFVYRFNGQPTWRQAVTPYKGAATKSPFVALATRA